MIESRIEQLLNLLEAKGFRLSFCQSNSGWQANAEVNSSTYSVGIGHTLEGAMENLWDQIKDRPIQRAAPKDLSLDDLFDAGDIGGNENDTGRDIE